MLAMLGLPAQQKETSLFNRKHFIENEDYFLLNREEALSTKFVLSAPTGLTLITESGYLMLVKSFTDDLAWEVQRQLVNNYFRVKAPLVPQPPATNYKAVVNEQLRRLHRIHEGSVSVSEFCEISRTVATICQIANQIN